MCRHFISHPCRTNMRVLFPPEGLLVCLAAFLGGMEPSYMGRISTVDCWAAFVLREDWLMKPKSDAHPNPPIGLSRYETAGWRANLEIAIWQDSRTVHASMVLFCEHPVIASQACTGFRR
ncbi:hypothetical protein BST61_g11353 [Cercospora zeina]